MIPPEEIINELTYRNFRENRQNNPSISLQRWEKVYGVATRTMEKRLVEETLHAQLSSNLPRPLRTLSLQFQEQH